MGTYHAVFCPARREFVERYNIKLQGYELPDHAGAFVYLMANRWFGHDVVFTADNAPPYETLMEKAEAGGWVNVWTEAQADWTRYREQEIGKRGDWWSSVTLHKRDPVE